MLYLDVHAGCGLFIEQLVQAARHLGLSFTPNKSNAPPTVQVSINHSVPASLESYQSLLISIRSHIDSSMFSYNSSLLASLATNLTAAIAAKSVAAVELLGFLAGSFTPANATTNGTSSSSGSGGPVLVSIAPAPSKTASASPVATGSWTSATGRVGVDGGLVGMAVTVVVVWVGLVVFA